MVPSVHSEWPNDPQTSSTFEGSALMTLTTTPIAHASDSHAGLVTCSEGQLVRKAFLTPQQTVKEGSSSADVVKSDNVLPFVELWRLRAKFEQHQHARTTGPVFRSAVGEADSEDFLCCPVLSPDKEHNVRHFGGRSLCWIQGGGLQGPDLIRPFETTIFRPHSTAPPPSRGAKSHPRRV